MALTNANTAFGAAEQGIRLEMSDLDRFGAIWIDSETLRKNWIFDPGHWIVNEGYWTVSEGYWTVNEGYWTVNEGYWTVNEGYWAVNEGYWTVNHDKEVLCACVE